MIRRLMRRVWSDFSHSSQTRDGHLNFSLGGTNSFEVKSGSKSRSMSESESQNVGTEIHQIPAQNPSFDVHPFRGNLSGEISPGKQDESSSRIPSCGDSKNQVDEDKAQMSSTLSNRRQSRADETGCEVNQMTSIDEEEAAADSTSGRPDILEDTGLISLLEPSFHDHRGDGEANQSQISRCTPQKLLNVFKIMFLRKKDDVLASIF